MGGVRMEIPLKKCLACGQLMFRKWYGKGKLILEQPTRYAKRKFCNNECKARAYRKVPRGVRACLQCRAEIRRKVWPSGAIETTKALRRRRFCDAECAALYGEDHGLRLRFVMRWRARQQRAQA